MKKLIKLKEIASYAKGSQINGDDLVENGVYEYLNGGINPSGKWNDFNTPGGTVTISEGGNSCGYVNYMENPFWCGAHCYYLYDTIQNTRYLYYALKSQQNRLMRIRTGACMPNIKKADLGAFELYFETDEKQQANIVSILEKAESIILIRQHELQKLDDLVKARFVEMFGNVKKLMTMNEVCAIITDGTHQPPKFSDAGIPFIFVSNITGDKVTYDAEKFIDQDTYDVLIKRTPIEIGDILLSTVGSYGHPAVVKTDKRFLFQRHIAYLKPKKELVDSDYLHGAILSPDAQRQIEEGVKGIAQKTLNLSEIKKMKIPVPSLDRQKDVYFARKNHSSRLISPPFTAI